MADVEQVKRGMSKIIDSHMNALGEELEKYVQGQYGGEDIPEGDADTISDFLVDELKEWSYYVKAWGG